MRTAADIVIRPLRDDDYPALARVHNAVDDTPATHEEMRQEVERIDRNRFVSEWLVGTDRATGEVVAYAGYRHSPWEHHPDKYRGFVNVHPDHERRGIGRRLMDEVLAALRARGAERVTAYAREDRPRAIAFLARQGFAEYARDYESRLDVSAVDPGRFGGYADRAAALGVTITTLADEMARDPHCLGAVYQAHCALDVGAPRDDPELPSPDQTTLDEFVAKLVQHPRALPDAFFLAKLGDFYVGLSMLMRSDGDPSLLRQELTGVLEPYRGRGIATALKLRTIAYAQRGGYRRIRTFNSSKNDAMLAINQKLGFVRQPAWIGFKISLRPATTP